MTTPEVELAVNGTLMRGLELNSHLTDIGGAFLRAARTEPLYRLWSIDDRHPAMIRTTADDGTGVAVELWRVPASGLAELLLREPGGLSIGKVRLDTGEEVLGVLAEPALVEGQREITTYGGWRAYLASLTDAHRP